MERASRRVLKPSKCSISTWQGKGKGKGRWQSAGKGLKLHGRVWGPGGTCFAQVLKRSKCRISNWQGGAEGERCTGWFRVPVQVWKPSKCNIRPGKALAKGSISTWQGKGKRRWQSAGKGLKLHGRVCGPGGTCFAQVLKPSKCRISTWQGRGKGRKVHRRVRVPVQVWKPSKCNIRPGKALAKG